MTFNHRLVSPYNLCAPCAAIFVALASLAFSLSAMAQQPHKHGSTGPNGGIMEDVAGVHAELLAADNTITVNIFDEDNKPLKTADYTASALVVHSSGGSRETIKLGPSGDSALKGSTKATMARSTQITLQIRTAAGRTGQARFKLNK